MASMYRDWPNPRETLPAASSRICEARRRTKSILAMPFFPMSRKQFLKDLAIGGFSIVAGLTARFLWLRWSGIITYAERHWPYVSDSANASLWWLLVSVPLVLGLQWISGRLWPRFFRDRGLPASLVFTTTFFASLLGVTWGFDIRPDLGLSAIPLAWAFGGVLCTIIYSSERLDAPVQRAVLSRPAQLLIDAGVIGLSFWLAYLFRFDGQIQSLYSTQLLLLLPYVIAVQIAANYLWGVYSFIWRFVGLTEAIVIVKAIGSTAALTILLRVAALGRFEPAIVPVGVVVMLPILAFFGMLGVRALRRLQYHSSQRRLVADDIDQPIRSLLLVGAGQAGQLLVRELEQNPAVKVVGFLDDDPRKIRRVIQGIRVLGATSELVTILRKEAIDEVVLCMPTAPKSVFRKVISRCEEMGVKTSSVPSLSDVVAGNVSIGKLRPVRMEDLLGRASIDFTVEDPRLEACYGGRRILVTGAAGSIGSELVRQLIEFRPERLIILDQDENGLFEIGNEIMESSPGGLVQVIANIREPERLRRVFARDKPQVVFHAAAYKHVPMMELHPAEAILNNVIGTRNVASLAADFKCECFVLISTDKAVNPSSAMGASKRLAEMVVQQLASAHSPTRFCCVRFGNVLGSRGSVVPLFQRQIAQGEHITVTHPEARRYFMSIPEAVQLVIQAGSQGSEGEIFVLDMGEPVRIVDLARELIERSGLVPGEDVKIRFTGLRPGEKLTEELLIDQETGIRNTLYPKIFVAQALRAKWTKLPRHIDELEEAARQGDLSRISRVLAALDIGYAKTDGSLAPDDASPEIVLKQ